MAKKTYSKISIWRWVAFGQSLLAVAGSLAFSYVWHLPACILCYYQRLLMIALLIILSGSIITTKRRPFWFAAPLALIGAGIAFYQNFIQLGWVSDPTTVCNTNTISCATKYTLPIPLLSALAFVVILGGVFFDREERLLK